MNLGFDLRYAWRLLTKSRGYSLLCASVVALSVGLPVWAYTLVYSQLLKPLGFPSERWYSVQIAAQPGERAYPNVDVYTYQELLKNNRSANYLGAFAFPDADATEQGKAVVLSEGQASTALRTVEITPRLFAATQVRPLLGRTLEDTDAQPGATAVAVLSFDTWQNYFAGDPAIIGKTARVDRAPIQIVGVMPKNFFMFLDYEIWLPLQMPNSARPQDSSMIVSPIIVLGGDQTLDVVLNEMKTTVDRVNRDYPDLFKATRQVLLFPGVRMYTHWQTPIVLMVAIMAVALLLLGSVNISMVFLARLLERSRELALRTALGASRARLLRQCLLETVLVVLLGLVGGFGLAAWGVNWAQGIGNFNALVLSTGRYPYQLALRPVDLAIAVIFASAIWLLSTLIPAWRVAKQEASVVLAGSGKGASVRSSNRSVGLLVGLQVVVASLVLVTCGNLVLSVNKEVSKPTGLNTAQVMVSTYPTVFDERYSEPTRRLRYWDDLATAIESTIPGAEAAFTTSIPSKPDTVAASIETQEGTKHQGTLRVPLTVVSDNYFKMLGLSLRTGRLFDSTDNNASLNVAIIDEKMIARYWPDENVLGKRIQLNPSDNGPWLTIVGVVSTAASAPYTPDEGVVYQPLRQAAPSNFQLLVKLPNATTDNRAAIRAAAFSVDRDVPLHNLQMLDVYLSALNLDWTTLVQTFGAIAIIAAVLAASGLFGLISRSVAQRTQEVGTRRALGATPWQAISIFLRQGAVYLSVAIVGVGFGTALMPLMSALLPNILDRVIPVTLGVVFLIAAAILTATYLPSRRAVILEPGDALRYE